MDGYSLSTIPGVGLDDLHSQYAVTFKNDFQVEIYKADERPLETILAEARREEIRIARDHLRMLGMDGLRALGTGVRRGAGALRSAVSGRASVDPRR